MDSGLKYSRGQLFTGKTNNRPKACTTMPSEPGLKEMNAVLSQPLPGSLSGKSGFIQESHSWNYRTPMWEERLLLQLAGGLHRAKASWHLGLAGNPAWSLRGREE